MKKTYLYTVIIFLILTSPVAIGQTWQNIWAGLNGPVYCMAVYNNVLYVGGEFNNAGGVPVNNIARWDGAKWDSVGSGVKYMYNGKSEQSWVRALCVFKGVLYIAGYYNTAGGISANGLTTYNGSSWNVVDSNKGDWTNYKVGYINSLVANDSLLYIAHGNVVDSYTGTNWASAQMFLCIDFAICDEQIAYCNSIALYNGGVVIGGSHLDTNNVNSGTSYPISGPDISLGVWDRGNSWNVLDENDGVYSLLSDSNNLYVGLNNTVSVYNGGTWLQLGASLSDNATSLCKYNGWLVAAGRFEDAGTMRTNNIAEWNGNTWTPLGAGIAVDSVEENGYKQLSNVSCMAAYNGYLYVAGSFDYAGGILANNIARWYDTLTPSAIAPVIAPAIPAAVFPNPNKGTFFCTLQNNTANCHMEIFDISGRQINDIMLNSGETEINMAGNAPPGIYIYRISEQGQQLSTGKFVIE